MNITFQPLAESHFSLLLKWLETPHVKAWWDKSVQWTPDSIQAKYASYVQGYKLDNGLPKDIHAFIIEVDGHPAGYIQAYNAYDFPRDVPLKNLPESLAAFDVFIGETEYLGRGLGVQAINQFLADVCAGRFEYALADPDHKNTAAIKAYENSGFKQTQENTGTDTLWMLKKLT